MSAYTGKPKHRALKAVCITLAVLLVLSAALLVWMGNYFFDFALNPHNPNGYAAAIDLPEDEYTRWLLAEAEDVYLTSADGLKLHAYRAAQAEGHNYAVICHGYMNDATGSSRIAQHFYGRGYTVLVPDARGHGESEGSYIGMGWHERRDIVAWCKGIVEADPDANILLMGVSMGGATVMMTTGEADLPANVKCAVEDCGYTSAWDEFSGQLKEQFGLPSFPILNVTSLVTKVRAGYFLREASAVEQVKKSVTPTLFIHGEEDKFVPYWMLDVVYEAAACEKEKLSVPGAEHAQSLANAPELYWRTVDAFVDRYMS